MPRHLSQSSDADATVARAGTPRTVRRPHGFLAGGRAPLGERGTASDGLRVDQDDDATVRSCRAGTLSRQRVDADGGVVFASERRPEDGALSDGAWCNQIRQQCLLGGVWDRLSPGGDAGEMVEHPTGPMHRDGRRPKPVARGDRLVGWTRSCRPCSCKVAGRAKPRSGRKS